MGRTAGLQIAFRFALAMLAGVVLATAFTPSVAAQSASIRHVTDPGGWFTIDLPIEWQGGTADIPPRGLQEFQFTTILLGVFFAIDEAEEDTFTLIAVGPGDVQQVRLGLNVIVVTLTSAVSSEGFAQLSEAYIGRVLREFKIVQRGSIQIGDRQAYFRHFTWSTPAGLSAYSVQVYLAVGTRVFVITGTTQNNPDRIRTGVPVLSQIIGTFRPVSVTR